jgi:hypothetical protein
MWRVKERPHQMQVAPSRSRATRRRAARFSAITAIVRRERTRRTRRTRRTSWAMQSAQRTALTAALTSVAHSLAGADGGNVEYDRALVDLTSAVLAIDRAAVAERILAPASPLLNDGTPGQSALGD